MIYATLGLKVEIKSYSVVLSEVKDLFYNSKMPIKFIMKKKYYLFIYLFLAGCAKFSFSLSSSSLSSLSILSPTSGAALVQGAVFNITGTCDPEGSPITFIGTSFSEPNVIANCASDGTFSTSATALNSGVLLDIQASQNDLDGNVMSNTVPSLMIHCGGAALHACVVSGSGNSIDAYMIDNISCLQEMRDGLTCHYTLADDIDASATSSWNPSIDGPLGWEPVPADNNNAIRFTGSLNGAGHSITDLYIVARNSEGVGLFSRVDDGNGDGIAQDQISDLTILNPTLRLLNINTSFGFVAGRAETIGINNVLVTNGVVHADTTTFSELGGVFVGITEGAIVRSSTATGVINLNGQVDNVLNKYQYIGGFIGAVIGSSSILDSSSAVSVISNPGNLNRFSIMGGAFGAVFESTIQRYRATSTLNLTSLSTVHTFGLDRVAGLSGTVDDSTLEDICVNTSISTNSVNLPQEHIAGFSGAVSYVGSVGDNITNVSLKGSLDISGGGNNVDYASAYVGASVGTTLHENIVSSLNVDISNATSSAATSGYGGIVSFSLPIVTLNNMLQYGTHNIAPGINTPGGIFFEDQSSFSSIYHANDVALGGLLPIGSGAPSSIVSESLANLAARTDVNYTGWDFTTVWQRDPITNMPELRYCPD